MSFIRNSAVGRFTDLTAKASRRKTKPCFYCPTEIDVGKGRKYCAACSDVVLGERNARARTKYAAARKAQQGRNA